MDTPSDPETIFPDERCQKPKALPRTCPRSVGQPFAPDRDGASPRAVPAPLASGAAARPARSAALQLLREEVRAIERRHVGSGHMSSGRAPPAPGWRPAPPPWRLGVTPIDRRLGPGGLDPAGLHEIKPARADDPDGHRQGAWSSAVAAALSFALSLGLCRGGSGRILWCWPAALAREVGGLHAPGLADLGLDPARLILAEPDKAAEVLWAMQEGLATVGLDLVVGALDAVQLTPARRLALTAAAHGVPGLLLTRARTPPAAATSSRWRIGCAPSAPHPLQAGLADRLPGAPRYRVLLELSRRGGAHEEIQPPVPGLSGPARPGPMTSPLVLEWSHASHRFRLAAAAADRAAGEDCAGQHPRRQATGAGGARQPR